MSRIIDLIGSFTVHQLYLPFITILEKTLNNIWKMLFTRCIFVLTKANNNDNFNNANDNRFKIPS